MKQFPKILKFELKNYFCNKVFVGITVFFMAAIIIVMSVPRIGSFFKNESSGDGTGEKSVMLICGQHAELLKDTFSAAFPEYSVKIFNDGYTQLKEEIVSERAECAFLIDNLKDYTYYVNNLSMYDPNIAIADELIGSAYKISVMTENGIPADVANGVLSSNVSHKTEMFGKDQMQNYFYTYIMIFALYMVILLYGQMIASNVATEKSSRAMELLITSAKPVSMMFGKVIASCIAGLTQLLAIFGTGFLSFNINKNYFKSNPVVSSIFDMPIELIIYMLIFFVLGFLVYAFMFAAVGSTASKLEDINTSVTPIILVFVAAFLVVTFAISSNNVDTPLMIACSYIPFTSPMAMFTRIAMSTVSPAEIIISIVILILSSVGVGVISAKIYRIGVLLYGNPPKLKEIIKALKKA